MHPNAPSHLEIDCDRLDHNITAIRKSLKPGTSLCCVVKADAYGLGAIPIAARLSRLGIEMLAVFTPEQARELIQAGIDARILLLMPLRKLHRHDLLYRALISNRLECVVHDAEHLSQLINIAESFGSILPLHVEIDTGMSRGGMTPAEAQPVIQRILNHRRLRLAGIMSHFACAEDPNHEATENQARQFTDLVQQFDADLLQTTTLHLANTHACFNFDKRFHFDLVRLGLAWVGYGNLTTNTRIEANVDENRDQHQNPQLLPIVRWLSTIIHTKWIEPGTPVGYASTFRAQRRTRIGLIPIGYADGYPLALSNRGIVRIARNQSPATPIQPHPQFRSVPRAAIPFPPIPHHTSSEEETYFEAPVIGQVSMDQIIIDLTDLPVPPDLPQNQEVTVDTTVELLSNDPTAPNSLPALAALAGSIPYEILCGIGSSIPRRYVDQQRRLRTATTPNQATEIKINQRQSAQTARAAGSLPTNR